MTQQERLVALEQQKSAMVCEVRAWPEELRGTRPANGGWSGLQVIDHVVRTESGICEVIAQGLGAPGQAGVRDRVGFLFLERVFLSGLRVKVPRCVEEIVSPGAAPD